MIESTETVSSPSVYLRRALIVATPILAVLGAIRFGLWWGMQSQRAMLRGLRWPPEPLMILLGR